MGGELEVKRRLSDELLSIIKNDNPYTTNFSNTALLYINRQTWEQMKQELFSGNPYPDDYGRMPILQLWGIPVMLYDYGIPLDTWELVQRGSGENITSGSVWQDEPRIAPQLSDIGICQNREHIPEPHLRSNSCALWRKVNQ